MSDTSLSWHLALRFLRGRGSRLLGSTARAAFAASALGVAAMGVGMALMTGYREDLEEKLVGGNAAILVYPPAEESAEIEVSELSDPIPESLALRLAALPGVERVEKVQYAQGVVTSSHGEFEITLRGADSGKGLVSARPADLAADESGVHGIALGSDLARRLDVSPGELLRLVVVGMGERGPKFVYRTVRFTATFDSGFAEFDQSWGVASRAFVQELVPGGVESLELSLGSGAANAARAPALAATIRGLSPPGTLVTDWRELNRELFAALALQQMALFLLLGLIVLVSTFNVASTLVVLVRERLRDLGVLAAMGLSPRRMRRVFLLYGGALGFAGVLAGLGFAWIVAWAATRFELVRFGPDVASIYFLRSVPFRLSLADAGSIAAFTLAVTFLSCWLPSRRALKLDPAAALRFE